MAIQSAVNQAIGTAGVFKSIRDRNAIMTQNNEANMEKARQKFLQSVTAQEARRILYKGYYENRDARRKAMNSGKQK